MSRWYLRPRFRLGDDLNKSMVQRRKGEIEKNICGDAACSDHTLNPAESRIRLSLNLCK